MLKGKSVLVTGASGWIGEGIALALLDNGVEVFAHHRSALPETLVGRVHALSGDLTSLADINDIAIRVREKCERLDGLVNNAAAQPVTPFLKITEAEYDEVLDAGLKGPFFLTQRLAPLLTGGSIVNIASIEGESAPPGHSHYGAAKAGILALTSTLARELAPTRVNAVLPGLIHRPGLEESWPEGVQRWKERAPLSRLGRREDVAAAVLFLLSDQSAWMTGNRLHVDGGIHSTSW